MEDKISIAGWAVTIFDEKGSLYQKGTNLFKPVTKEQVEILEELRREILTSYKYERKRKL